MNPEIEIYSTDEKDTKDDLFELEDIWGRKLDKLRIKKMDGFWNVDTKIKFKFDGELEVSGVKYVLQNCEIDYKGRIRLFGHGLDDKTMDIPWRYLGGFVRADKDWFTFAFVERAFTKELAKHSMESYGNKKHFKYTGGTILWLYQVKKAVIGVFLKSPTLDVPPQSEYNDYLPFIGISDTSTVKV